MNFSPFLRLLLVGAVSVWVAGCGARAEVDAGTIDAGTPALDAGMDAGTDAGTDAGMDAGVDAGLDAGLDAGPSDFAIEAFTASREQLPLGGGDVRLSWSVVGAEHLELDHGVGPVTAASIDVTVRRPIRYTLTATKGARQLTASLVIHVEAPPLTSTIDPSLQPMTTMHRPDGGLVPLAAARDADGVVSAFIANELIVAASSRDEAEHFAQQHGGTVVGDDAIPAPPPSLGLTLTPDELRAHRYVVRIDASATSIDQLPAAATSVGLGGALAFSSTAGAKLVTLCTAEQAAGHAVSLNHVTRPSSVLNATAECSSGSGCLGNAFAQSAFLETGSRADVVGAWQFIAAGANTHRVKVAIIDSGFWVNQATGQPNSLPGIGSDYPNILGQYDFDADRSTVGASNASDCGGTPCDWHGNGAANVALGVVNNGLGAAGTGGLVSDALLLHSSLSIFQNARALRTARAWGAEVISMSFGGDCNSLCDLGKIFTDPMGNAVAEARGARIVMVAAAGNDHHNASVVDHEPCTLDGVVCVGALDDGKQTEISYSNFGPSVDIWAPTDLLAVYAAVGTPTGLMAFGGTSCATPFVAGIAAMVRAVDPSLDSDQVRDLLRSTGWAGATNAAVTFAVNAQAAVRAAARNQLLADALEKPASVLPSGRVDNLSIHSPTDRDRYPLVVAGPSQFKLTYGYSSRLGELGANLQLVKGCGTITGLKKGPGSEPATALYNITYLPPGEYSLNFGASLIGSISTPDLTGYWVDWHTTPTTPLFAASDDFEPNNSVATASQLVNGQSANVTLHLTDDVDYYRVKGEALVNSGPLTLDSYFSIPSTDTPLRLTLFTAAGEATGTSVDSDANCQEPLGLHIPEGDYRVKVERLSPGSVRYQVGFGHGIAGVFVPHAPLKWEAKKGLPLSGILSDLAVDHLYLPDGNAQLVQLVGADLTLSLLDAQGHVVDTAVSVPGFEGLVLPLSKATSGQVFFLELTRQDIAANTEVIGRLPGLPYQLTMQ